MTNILDESEFQKENLTKTILLFSFFSLILNLFYYYILRPIIPKKMFSFGDFAEQTMGIIIIVILIVVCYFLHKKLNKKRPGADEKLFALWGALCILFGEALFKIIAFYLIDQSATISDTGFMIMDTMIMSVQGGFISYVLIHFIRDKSTYIPLLMTGALFYTLDYMYTMNWIQ